MNTQPIQLDADRPFPLNFVLGVIGGAITVKRFSANREVAFQ